MTNSSCGIKNKWCWKKTFLLLNLCNGCRFAYHYSYWIFLCSNVFVWSLLLIFLLPKLTFNWLWFQCSYHTSFSKWLKQNDVFFSSGNISVFPLLLQQSDDSNCILLPIQHITYNFYHLFFLISRFVCLRSSLFHVVCSQVRCACIMYIIAVSYAKSIKCTWDRHCLYFFTTLLCYYVVHFTYYWQ